MDALESTYRARWARTKSATNMRSTVNLIQREIGDMRLGDMTTKVMRATAMRGSRPAPRRSP